MDDFVSYWKITNKEVENYARSMDLATLSTKSYEEVSRGVAESMATTVTEASRASKLIEGLKNIGMNILTTGVNMAIMTAVTWGISGIAKLIDGAITTAEEAAEKAASSFSDYESVKGQLEGVNTELDATRSRIDELNAKESLSFVEQEELDKLHDATEQLTIQQDILHEINRGQVSVHLRLPALLP